MTVGQLNMELAKSRIQSNLSCERTWDRCKLIRELGSQMEFQNKDQYRCPNKKVDRYDHATTEALRG